MKHIERTPLQRIRKMAVYENTRKLPLSRIVAEEQPDIALTGNYYDPRKWKPVCPLKADGEVLYTEQCTYVALAWDNGQDVCTVKVPPGGVSEKRNYFANGLAVYQGGGYPLTGHDDTGGRRGRVACGLTRQGEWLTYACTDGSADAITPEDLRDELATMNLETAIINDGGRKVNLYIRDADILWEGRDPSQNLILIWLHKEGEKDMDNRPVVVIDAGHDAGNLANASPDRSYFEHEFALDMAKRMKAVLEAGGVKVVETRPDGAAVSLEERCAIEKASGASLFVSLHSNAENCLGWGSARGWRVLIYGLSGARYAAAMAVQSRVEGVAPAMRNPPIKEAAGYYVLKNTKAPALLIEHGFHTNKEDVELLKNPEYRAKLAYAEAAGILDHLGLPSPAFVPEKTEAEQAVDWITGAGIMLGNTSGDLMLDQPLTRKQFAVMLYRYDQQQK